MQRVDIAKRVRSYTRDFSSSIFRTEDVINYINEGINRMKEVVPELIGMLPLEGDTQEPILLPSQYHYLLAVYCSSRCFAQDERNFQAVSLMNEFENKLESMYDLIMGGRLVILDSSGDVVDDEGVTDYVRDVYFNSPPQNEGLW